MDEFSHTTRPTYSRGILLKSFLAFLLSSLVFIVALLVLAQTDYQTILFVRSIEHPLIKKIGDLGNQIGHGVTLVFGRAGEAAARVGARMVPPRMVLSREGAERICLARRGRSRSDRG